MGVSDKAAKMDSINEAMNDDLVTLMSPVHFGETEAEEAKAYWSGRAFNYYKRTRVWTDFMADEILSFSPSSVFEFGCNVGKNLLAIKARAPRTFTAGVDINGDAVQYGRTQNHLSLVCGDEQVCDIIPDGTYDVVFTVSVLDHIPDPKPTLANLARISRGTVLLLEPFTGGEGKVVQNIDSRSGNWIETTPFSYSWDYVRLVETHLPGWRVETRDFPMDSNLGRFYKYYKITRVDEPQA